MESIATGDLFPEDDREKETARRVDPLPTPTEVAKVARRKPVDMVIAAGKLKVDPVVQREVPIVRVRKIAAALDLDAIGIVHVSDRGRADYYIIDGQTRVKAILLHNLDAHPVKCHVYRGLSLSQEAQLFRLFNQSWKAGQYDAFTKGVIARDKDCVAISEIVMDAGLEISKAPAEGRIACIAALRLIHEEDRTGGSMRFALSVVISAWGPVRGALNAHLLRALAMIYLHRGDNVSASHLSVKLTKYHGGPAGLIARAKGYKDTESGHLYTILARTIISYYNKGRSTGKLAQIVSR